MSEHRSLEAAMAWVDATTESLGPEDVRLPAARGRVLAEAIHGLGPIPCENRAALDGFAIQASASLGASSYNPIRLPLIGVNAGDALPAGADAVVPLQLAERDNQAAAADRQGGDAGVAISRRRRRAQGDGAELPHSSR